MFRADRGLEQILRRYRDGRVSLRELLRYLKQLPFQDLGFAKVDLHRSLRRGFPEVIYARGKSVKQVVAVAETLHQNENPVLITKVSGSMGKDIQKSCRWLTYFPEAQIAAGPFRSTPQARWKTKGFVMVVTAGTTDIPVAEEAIVTLRLMGIPVRNFFDIGVAGLPRLIAHFRALSKARILIVVAGMDGALPSVISGLVGCPVIAVPTSVGYGASFKGLAALLAMLNSCSPGIAIVNIDNGFGAGYLAYRMLQRKP